MAVGDGGQVGFVTFRLRGRIVGGPVVRPPLGVFPLDELLAIAGNPHWHHSDLAGRTDFKGLTLSQLAQSLRVDSTQLEPVLQALARLDWVGQLDELPPAVEPRYVLLADPDRTLLEPLMKLLLLELAPSTQTLWDNARWSTLTMRQVLSEGV